MIRIASDYGEGAHPRILQALQDTNLTQNPGYGEDEHCLRAALLIREACAAPKATVHFVPGGTQANLLVLAAALRPHQAALAAQSGHINVHETGAIEATGHKVLALPGTEGKLTAAQVAAAVQAHHNDPTREHTPQPALVYISFPTEYGTLYTREELAALWQTCQAHGLYLYVDGARMGYGLCAATCEVDLPFFATHCDAFTIGGTKVGALMGEAIVLPGPSLARDFRYIMKQRGAMLAKGWLLGLQFATLFEDGLYFEGARHAMAMATLLAEGLQNLGVPFLMPAATNQIFPILPNEAIDALRESYVFESWEAAGAGRTAVRFCTAWSTREEDVRALLQDVTRLLQRQA